MEFRPRSHFQGIGGIFGLHSHSDFLLQIYVPAFQSCSARGPASECLSHWGGETAQPVCDRDWRCSLLQHHIVTWYVAYCMPHIDVGSKSVKFSYSTKGPPPPNFHVQCHVLCEGRGIGGERRRWERNCVKRGYGTKSAPASQQVIYTHEYMCVIPMCIIAPHA